MAKSKNHTNHNQTAKHHKGGIKKPREQKYLTTRMVNQKLRRNIKRSRMFDHTIKKSANLAKRIAVRVQNKAKRQQDIKAALIKKAIGTVPAKPAAKAPAPAAKKDAKQPAPKK